MTTTARRYTVTIVEERCQTVTFIAEDGDAESVTRMGAAACHPDLWEHTRYARKDLTSERVRIETIADEPDYEPKPMAVAISDLQGA